MIKINLAPQQKKSKFHPLTFAFAIIAILLMAKSALAVLEPAKDIKNAPTNDLFINYQWALFNNKQVVINDLDDIHPLRVNADPKANINWENFDKKMQKDVVVAVL